MRYLFDNWKKIEKLIKKSPQILLLADYDGTLTPLVAKPKDAILDNFLRETLKSLSKRKRFYIGIISGRKLDDVKGLVKLEDIYYAGNHGLEINGPGIDFIHPLWRRYSPYLARIKKELLEKTSSVKGRIVEYKGGSLSLHYRLVRKKHIKRLKSIFDNICTTYVKKKKIRLSRGKKVWEIKLPVKWDKGKAVDKILTALKRKDKDILPIYLGDDITDEDVFSFLKNKKALSIFIGRKNKKSSARFYLKSPDDVKKFLVRLCRI